MKTGRVGLLALLALLTTLVVPPALYAQRQRSIEEEILVGISETVREAAGQAMPKTVLIKIQVGGQEGYGSGALISDDGYILSCAHVIEPGKTLTVVTSDGTEYRAEKLGLNSTNDYGLLKIDARGLPFFELGDSDAVRVRDWVIALGHPGGPYADLQPAVAVGRVRALHKQLPVQMNQKFYDDAIQTDCPIFGGNSGGPLIDLEGRLIGINGAILLAGDHAYAAPINEIAAELDEFRAGRDVAGRKAENMAEIMKGLQEDLDPEALQKMYGDSPFGRFLAPMMGGGGKPVDRSARLDAAVLRTGDGLVLGAIEDRGTAHMSGLAEGDRIGHIGGMKIEGEADLERVLGYFRKGETTLFEVVRGGERLPVLVTFGFRGLVRDAILKRGLFALGLESGRTTVRIAVDGQPVGFGVVLDEAGWIVTSERLVQGDGKVTVSLFGADGDVEATVVGREGQLDVALLRIEAGDRPLVAATVGDSEHLLPGAWVVSGGDFRGPRAVGAISAVGRAVGSDRKAASMGLFGMGSGNQTPMRPYVEVIQHDSTLEPGDFGSPLFDVEGRLIGINVASFHRGTSHAVPIHRVMALLDELKAGLTVAAPPVYTPSTDGMADMFRQFFGGGGEGPRPDENAPFLGIQVDQTASDARGVVIGEVIEGTAADAGGLETGDVIVSFAGEETPTFEALVGVIRKHAAGDEVAVGYLRGDDEREAVLTLGKRGNR